MTRSNFWIGVGAFGLATMVTVDLDTSSRDIALRDILWRHISLGGAPALAQYEDEREGAQISLEDLARNFIQLQIGDGDDDDEADDGAVTDDDAEDDDADED